ncbi:MAG: acyl-CoA dehydrogenase [Myxococcales bacterium]|nr:acyl-CoA dehydrogenase [Myxococcales bacterium]
MSKYAETRAALSRWQVVKSLNYFEQDAFLQRLLLHHLGPAGFEAERAGLSDFGGVCATTLDELIRENNRDEHLPVLRRYDAIGRRTEEVIFHPSYLESGRLIYKTGVIARYADPGFDRAQLAYVYLLGHHGEGGHLCPLACTTGLVKLLLARGDESLKARFVPGLLHLDRQDPEHLHGAQFLTEIQGGSDVGANACLARRDGEHWRIDGEKWFCSVIDADLYLMTARFEGGPRGTAGLGAFIVPRLLDDGTPNGCFIRRLKTKLGTRSMASGELDLQGALAYAIGDVEGGFKAVVDVVLNTSRLYNAVAACGIMRRAEIEATTYAHHRQAFGQNIAEFPLVAASLARLKEERELSLAGTYALIALADAAALNVATQDDRDVSRLVVNMNKYFTSIRATAMVHEAIEVLGGNGAIEDFSVLPRLWRDCIVLESWEGTHNVLCAQVLKDLQKLSLHRAFFRRCRSLASSTVLLDEVRLAESATTELIEFPGERAALEIRPLVDRLMRLWQRVCLESLGPFPGGAIEASLPTP